MHQNRLRRAGAALIALTGILHLVLAPEYLEEQPYVGLLFVLAAAVCSWVAARLWRGDDPRAWIVGALASAGMISGFLLSRTAGLPGFHESDWELSGVASLLFEAAFLATAYAALVPRRSVART